MKSCKIQNWLRAAPGRAGRPSPDGARFTTFCLLRRRARRGGGKRVCKRSVTGPYIEPYTGPYIKPPPPTPEMRNVNLLRVCPFHPWQLHFSSRLTFRSFWGQGPCKVQKITFHPHHQHQQHQICPCAWPYAWPYIYGIICGTARGKGGPKRPQNWLPPAPPGCPLLPPWLPCVDFLLGPLQGTQQEIHTGEAGGEAGPSQFCGQLIDVH